MEKFKYNFFAFLFTFMYFFSKCEYVYGIVIMLVLSIVPIKNYFLVALLVGYLATNYLKPKSSIITAKGLLLSCASMIVFCLLKLVLLNTLHYM